MATTQATTVGTSAVLISQPTAFAVHGSQQVVVSNAGATDMFVGPSAVTASGANCGVIVKAGTNLPLAAIASALWAISTGAGTTAVVGVF